MKSNQPLIKVRVIIMKLFLKLIIAIAVIGTTVLFSLNDNSISKSTTIDVSAETPQRLQISVANRGMSSVSAFRESKKEEKVEELDIRVMTYNIHRGVSRNGKLDLDSIASIIHEAGVDIVALQEVERNSVRTRFQDQIKLISDKLSVEYAYGKSLNILNGQYGNAILSRHPIEEYEVISLPSDKEKRTVLRAVVNIDGIRIAVYNTHLGLSKLERDKQLFEIKALLMEELLSFILMGDFNTGIIGADFIEELLIDTASILSESPPNTFVNGDIDERIDYIFTSLNITPTEHSIIISDASDHYPVVGRLKIKLDINK